MRSREHVSWVVLSVILTACVTVNVYFPAAAAEQAADRFIKDVYGNDGKEEAPPQQTPLPDKQGGGAGDALGQALLKLFVPSAYAQQPDINVATPAIDQLKAQMTGRHDALGPYYGSGAVGMTSNGLLEVRDAKVVPLQERNAVKQLVADENRDRNALYAEIAQANGHPEWEPQIRQTFAERWIGNAGAGWWYQDASGAWRQR